MILGACRIVIGLDGVRSLKEKRGVVRALLDRVRARFDASAAEVEDMDVHERAVLGFAVVSNDEARAHQVLAKIERFVIAQGLAEVREVRTETVHALTPKGGAAEVLGDWAAFDDEASA